VPAGYRTTSTAFLEAPAEADVIYIFANLGSDHPGLIEAFAQARVGCRDLRRRPRPVVCVHLPRAQAAP
jgi:acetolactate synthase I/II/III large subunit